MKLFSRISARGQLPGQLTQENFQKGGDERGRIKDLVKFAEELISNELLKEYPTEGPNWLHQLKHQIAELIIKINSGSNMDLKVTHNMWENLKKAASDMVDGQDSVPESVKKFLDDLTHDIKEMEKQGGLEIKQNATFANISEEVARKVKYGTRVRSDICYDLRNNLHRIMEHLHRIIDHLREKFRDVKDFFLDTMQTESEILRPDFNEIKRLAQDLLNNFSVVSKNVAEQAIEFFEPFLKQLGNLRPKLCRDKT